MPQAALGNAMSALKTAFHSSFLNLPAVASLNSSEMFSEPPGGGLSVLLRAELSNITY